MHINHNNSVYDTHVTLIKDNNKQIGTYDNMYIKLSLAETDCYH